MELAIPIVALGGLYVLSNQNSENRPENFANYDTQRYVSKPGEGTQYKEEPDEGAKIINTPNIAENSSNYNDSNMVSDRFFTSDVNKIIDESPDQFGNKYDLNNFTSLTGEQVNPNDLAHNNMVPYFGAKIKGRTANANEIETSMDYMTGAGSQTIKKTEQAPLFKPQKNLQYSNGAPNYNDFLQARVNPGSNISNVKPWAEIQVAPGLDNGFSSVGEGGFNSGMVARDKWADRNVDQLRTVTNPKVSYSLDNHQGPATFYNNLGASQENQGKVEKYNPDTYYINTPDRWFTTTGIEQKPTARAIEVNKDVNRTTTTSEYYGTSGGDNNTYAPQNYEKSKRTQLKSNPMINCGNKCTPSQANYGRPGYVSLPNNRSENQQKTEYGIFSGLAKAAVAPLMDILRPSRKEDFVGNGRLFENAGSNVPHAPIYNPKDRPGPTIKDTTVGKQDFKYLNMERQTAGGYQVNEQQPIENNRMNTNYESYGNTGGPGGQTGVMTYNAAYNQRNNVNKTYLNRPNQGGMGLLGTESNVCVNVSKECDLMNNRANIINTSSNTNVIPSTQNFGEMRMPQTYNNDINCDRMDPGLLEAFKKNPYTQSLQSY
tara:strand:- start:300 stop:2102 length:1803 start_codon:yes stop_codon:yes gene_type:complete